MAFRGMWNEVLGTVPGLQAALAKTKVNEALQLIYDEQLWSFQLATGGWLTPGLLGGLGYASGGLSVSPGLISVKPYQNQVTGNATASAAWLGLVGRPFLTEMQFRVPSYSVYSIVGVDSTNPAAVVLTLDRPWMEPAQTNAGYMIYQCYFATPPGFKRFRSVRDTTNNAPIDFWSLSEMDLAVRDPERTIFNLPSYFVPYQVDNRPNTSTPGQMLYEMWPHPLSQLPYTFGALVSGPLLFAPTDTVPYPLNDELVKWRALETTFLWKEAQAGDDRVRGSGADWRFLAQAANKEYLARLKTVKLLDQQILDLYFTRFRRELATTVEPFATINGALNVGSF